MPTAYLGNAFSLQMIPLDLWEAGYTPKITHLSAEEMWVDLDEDPTAYGPSRRVHTWLLSDGSYLYDLFSVVGHEDTAKVLGVAYKRLSITLHHSDVLYVAQLMGGRLPEGSTTLPEGFHFEFFKVKFVKD